MIKAIVTDVEGTTSSLSFVKEVLFPYARARLFAFVHAHRQDPAVRAHLDEVAQLEQWIDEDKKLTPLKALQGMIWEEGYRRGDFTGHVYDDAVRQLRHWKERGIRLYVFSSGSVQAQRLLFGYSDHGDLMPLFSGYFDTTVGAKREAAAYEKIATTIGIPPAHILFLSDIKEELDAARDAGMQTTWLVRDAALDPNADHPQVRDFDAIAV
jgi:enolase-phosphatase E1